MRDWEYTLIAGAFLVLTAIGKTLDSLRKKEIAGRLGIISSLIFSLIGGLIAGMAANVYIETEQLQYILIAGGAWMGERVLEAIADSVEDKIDLIFKKKKDGTK